MKFLILELILKRSRIRTVFRLIVQLSTSLWEIIKEQFKIPHDPRFGWYREAENGKEFNDRNDRNDKNDKVVRLKMVV